MTRSFASVNTNEPSERLAHDPALLITAVEDEAAEDAVVKDIKRDVEDIRSFGLLLFFATLFSFAFFSLLFHIMDI